MLSPSTENRSVVLVGREAVAGTGAASRRGRAETSHAQATCDRFGQPFLNGLIGSDLFAQAHEGSYDKDAHVNRSFAVENVGTHHAAMLGERPRTKPRISVVL
jgi:hypothetical protein